MPDFKRSELTEAVIRYLMSLEKGEQISYGELSRALSAEITAATPSLRSAMAILERDHCAVWCCKRPGVGIWRLNDREIADRQRRWYLRGARSKLKASAAQAEVVDIGHLNIDEQARFATDSIVREVASEALSRATRRKIEKTARGTSNDLPSFNAVEWMISLSPRRQKEA